MRLIDADALRADAIIRSGGTEIAFDNCYPFWQFSQAIAQAPIIEAAPVVHGRWVDRYGGKYDNPVYDCSECKNAALGKLKRDELGTDRFVQELSGVCPHCGTRMDGDHDA